VVTSTQIFGFLDEIPLFLLDASFGILLRLMISQTWGLVKTQRLQGGYCTCIDV
jgi:hypothetical protein